MVKISSEIKGSSVSVAFQRSRDDIGYPAPYYVASQLISDTHPLHSQIQREMYYHPTRPFLFWGTRFTIRQLLRKGDAVTIWSDEYPQRIDSSKLHNLQKHGNLSFILGENKENVIPALFAHAQESGIDEMIVVDNQLAKLQAVQAYTEEYPDIKLRLLLVTKSTRRYKLESTITEIPSIRRIRRVARNMSSGKRLWVFDFNDTLFNRTSFERSLERRVRSIVS